MPTISGRVEIQTTTHVCKRTKEQQDTFQADAPRNIPAAKDSFSQVEQGPTAVKYGIWIVTLLLAIGAFYGAVFAASGGISSFLRDRVTFTRKDFVPYSERRRLEAEFQSRSQQPTRQSEPLEENGAQYTGVGDASPNGVQSLYDLLPTRR